MTDYKSNNTLVTNPAITGTTIPTPTIQHASTYDFIYFSLSFAFFQNAPELERKLFVEHQKRTTAIKPPAQKLVGPQVHMGALKNGTVKQTART